LVDFRFRGSVLQFMGIVNKPLSQFPQRRDTAPMPFRIQSRRLTQILSALALTIGTSLAALAPVPAQAGQVVVQKVNGQWALVDQGRIIPMRGVAVGNGAASLEKLRNTGTTVVRTYGEPDVWVLDEAQKYGLKVIMGLWMEHPRLGFSYQNQTAVEAQDRRISEFVTRYKDHPALLAWGVGNEVETDVADPLPVWKQVNRVAEMVKKIDPNHPTMMVVADTEDNRLQKLAGCCAAVDLLGINVYAGAVFTLPERVQKAGIVKPIIATEVGALGQWQAGRTAWGAPVEPSSTQKAIFFHKALPFLESQPNVLGSIAFMWGAKQEQTSTWHGLLLPDGSPLGAVDTLTELWNGKQPNNRAPEINGAGIAAEVYSPGDPITVGLSILDPDGDPIKLDFRLMNEATDLQKGGDAEAVPPEMAIQVETFPGTIALFDAPTLPGDYRLFVTVHDPDGKAATVNMPFQVVGPAPPKGATENQQGQAVTPDGLPIQAALTGPNAATTREEIQRDLAKLKASRERRQDIKKRQEERQKTKKVSTTTPKTTKKPKDS